METWPIRFDTVKDMPGAMEVSTYGQFVEYEDFQSILYFCAGYISATPQFETTHPENVAKWILNEYKESMK